MVVESVLHMNAGDGESSYANNSVVQKTVILNTQPVLDGAIRDIYNNSFRECLTIADFGCSSGPNTLLVVSNIIDTIHGLCVEDNRRMPEIQVSLNDLPQNDFNDIFKSLPEFFDKLREEKGESLGPCFISGVPGSFYGRVFPSKSVDFVYSSYSVHWLSQVPEGLENNKGNIYMSKTSPPDVFEAYLKQFQKDFTLFLRLRAEEIKPGGNVVLAFLARSLADPASNDCCCIWYPLVKSLFDMEAEGLVKEADIDSFNVPVYTPYKDEVTDIITEEGSFDLTRLEGFGVNWDASENDDHKDYLFDKHKSGEIVAKRIRAISETIVANHFGDSIMDDLYARYAKHIGEHLAFERTKHFSIVMSLKRKS
ncbi:hypothetical protein RJ639_023338 [Escallonia herrerae]|uniref:Uncharacterized protein n=1 Tax=Escallonia herrerae TaxID=1293975 RepID=A0AA88V1H6_9ASTE|nr:hypothetical protein RJ639_023338 [Escallonia herrerae]